MRVLVTGAGGGLGQEIPPAFKDCDLILPTRQQLDVTDQTQVQEQITAARPDIVVHAAAYTAVDKAESEPEQAHRVNVSGTGLVATAAQAVGAALVYVSTDYVFDGTKQQPYLEDDVTNPLSVYGQTKLDGERAAAEANANTYIVRTSWLYSRYGKSFVSTMLRLFAEREELSVVADEVSSPTYAGDFAIGLRQLIDSGNFGTYHLSSGGETSWYEYVREIARRVEATITLNQTTAAEYGMPAKRPPYSKLDVSKAAALGIELPRWQDGLGHFFADTNRGSSGE